MTRRKLVSAKLNLKPVRRRTLSALAAGVIALSLTPVLNAQDTTTVTSTSQSTASPITAQPKAVKPGQKIEADGYVAYDRPGVEVVAAKNQNDKESGAKIEGAKIIDGTLTFTVPENLEYDAVFYLKAEDPSGGVEFVPLPYYFEAPVKETTSETPKPSTSKTSEAARPQSQSAEEMTSAESEEQVPEEEEVDETEAESEPKPHLRSVGPYSARAARDLPRYIDPNSPVPANHGRLIVSVGGDRAPGTNNVTGLEGAVLEMRYRTGERVHDAPTGSSWGIHWENTGDAVNEEWARCISGPDGLCVFDIPSQALNTGEGRYWVAAHSAPEGWNSIQELRTGFSGGGFGAGRNFWHVHDYAYLTPPINDGETIRSGFSAIGAGREFMRQRRSQTWLRYFAEEDVRWPRNSSQTFMFYRDNPVVEQRCELNVGVIMDGSGSVRWHSDTDAHYIPQVQNFFDDMAAEGVDVGMFGFGSSAPLAARTTHPEPRDLNVGDNLATFKDSADRIANTGGSTNWDQALRYAADQNSSFAWDKKYDVVLFLTDGNPTLSPIQSGGGNVNEFANTEAAVASANRLKAQGVRIMPIGVGAFLDDYGAEDLYVSQRNLQAISGPLGYGFGTDNIAEADWAMLDETADLGSWMTEFVRETRIAACSSQITVEKQLIPEGETEPQPAGAGWEFTAQAENPEVRVNGEVDGVATQATDDTSTTTFNLLHANERMVTSANMSEIQQEGWALVDLRCHDVRTSQPVEVDNFTPGSTNWTLRNLSIGSHVHCIVINTQGSIGDTPVNIWFEKWGAEGGEVVPLTGAEFELTRLGTGSEEDGATELVADPEGNGSRWSAEVTAGIYRLVETRAPQGYSLLPEPIVFSVEEDAATNNVSITIISGGGTGVTNVLEATDGLILQVNDVQTGELPKTGGVGFLPFMLSSLILILGAGMAMRRRTTA